MPAQKGELGSMLNTVGQSLTNHFQHAAVDNTRLHIPLLFGADVIHGFRTIFPVPLATASSWDPALVTDLAHMAAIEARTAGVNWFYSPMVDIARDARWGRCTEGAGEDPYLGSAIARAYLYSWLSGGQPLPPPMLPTSRPRRSSRRVFSKRRMRRPDTHAGCFASNGKILQCGVIVHHADSLASSKPVVQRRIPDGEKLNWF